MLKRIVDRIRPVGLGPELTYEKARAVLESESDGGYRALAKRADVPGEMLYYLAENGKPVVRGLVASNPATPHKADLMLVEDENDDVRCALARKLARLLPDLSREEHVRLREGTIEMIERLAADHLPKVRAILAEELKTNEDLPRKIALTLARDVAAIVAAPILEYSPLLSDDDLLEIIASTKTAGTLEAIARRSTVSQPVSDAVVATLDIPAVAALLANPNAQIREQTLDMIIEHAESIEPWHAPLVMRPDLSVRAVRRIAGFVASSLVDKLAELHEMDEELSRLIKRRARERIDMESDWAEADAAAERAVASAQAAVDAGRLDKDFVEAAASAGNRELCIEALRRLADIPAGACRRILASRNGKAITALAWKAELPMRTALILQNALAHVPREGLVLARDGVHYPLTPDEMNWYLDYFTSRKG